MPFVLMALVSGGVAVWLFGVPSRRASLPREALVVAQRIGTTMLMRPDVAGIRGWLFGYVIMLGVQALHSLGLSIAALIIEARPSLAGLHSFVPLPPLVFYELSNLSLVVYTVALYVLMVRRRESAIAHNVICNALAVALLVVWHLLGMKSALGVIIDGLPSIVGVCYILGSRRVRNTFVVT